MNQLDYLVNNVILKMRKKFNKFYLFTKTKENLFYDTVQT